ncbi:MAG: hypothetical protein ACLPN5_22650 [Roseiarcus sp.]
MKRYLLVFDDGNGDPIDLRGFVDSLDAGATMYTLDGHVCFLQSKLSVTEVSDHFLKIAGSRFFFVTDMTHSDYSGRMPGYFWNDLKSPSLSNAAE